jgi:hypothetical protein
MDLKDLIHRDNTVHFARYFDGNLWYHVITPNGDKALEFPVPIADIGNATFLAVDRAPLFMRYIRKHLEMLEQAKKDQGT